MVQAISTNTFGTAKWIVSADATQGTHTTIAGAIASATAGDTIFIRPGTYTENITLKVGVNLAAYVCDALTPNVTISGTATLTTAGTVSISGINLQTNSAAAIAVTGTLASVLNLRNCNLNFTNNSGITFSSSSASAAINILNCTGDLGTTGINIISHSSAGTTTFVNVFFTNSGASTTASTCSAGMLLIKQSSFTSPFAYSSAATGFWDFVVLNSSATNTTSITTSNTSEINIINSRLSSGTAATLSIGAGTTISGTNLTVASSNTNPITGAGTYANGGTTFTGTGIGINSTTQSSLTTQLGRLRMPLQPAFLAYQSSSQVDATGDGTEVAITFTTEVFDQAGNYDGTSSFTAPVTGRYFFQFSVRVSGLLVGHTGGFMRITTSNRTYLSNFKNWFAGSSATTFSDDMSVFADLDAGDTAFCTLTISGGTKVVDTDASTDMRTRFAGYLVC